MKWHNTSSYCTTDSTTDTTTDTSEMLTKIMNEIVKYIELLCEYMYYIL